MNRRSGPHHTIIGNREVRQIRQAMRRLADQLRGSPSADPAHGYARIRRAISPSPGNVTSAGSAGSSLLTGAPPGRNDRRSPGSVPGAAVVRGGGGPQGREPGNVARPGGLLIPSTRDRGPRHGVRSGGTR